jgi:RNA polymerase sigma factor (TIGR02999 family)
MEAPEGEITQLLSRLAAGDASAEELLIPLVYGELRRMAARYMRAERTEHTLQATALVHEAFLRIRGQEAMDWKNRAHFFAVAAQQMRRILVDHARNVRAEKRSGRRQRIPLDTVFIYAEEQSAELIALDEALDRLSAWDSRQCRVVELKFFGGLSMEEIGAVLGVSSRTAKRDFNMARAWLFGELTRGEGNDRGEMGPS